MPLSLMLIGLVGVVSSFPGTPGRRAAPALVPNDNRTPAGTLSNGVLTLKLVAQAATLFPEGPSGVGISVFGFGEEGKAPQAPGPLIRIPAGTELRISVRNTLPELVRLRGLQDHGTALLDTFDLAPGATREIRFRANTPGTYYYWGRTQGNLEGLVPFADSHLLGAFIVDPPGTKGPPKDRVLVIETFRDTLDVPGQGRRRREVIVLNGLSWPHTERLSHTVGDTVRWRVLNVGIAPHPMHLHGFYFKIDSKGDATRDTIYTEPQRRTGVTEELYPGDTMTLTWVPTRPGNWLFHCHLIFHIDARLRLGEVAAGHQSHAESQMAGLVMGIKVNPAKGMPAIATDPVARRKLRLFVNQREKVFGDRPGFSFVLQQGAAEPARDSILRPSSTIVLYRNQPAEITVINHSSEMASTHWHGIELQSYYDGVSDWSGWGTRTAPVLAPGDSFVVRMTPDRAGTFIYHTHSNETVQLTSGLYGPLIVLPEEAEPDSNDRIFLLGDGGPGGPAAGNMPFINGSTTPPPIELRAGTLHRFRLINISAAANKLVRLVADSVQQWRAFAKDGYDLPPNQATLRPAIASMGPGETWDFEVKREQAGSLTLEVITSPGPRQIVARVPVVVR